MTNEEHTDTTKEPPLDLAQFEGHTTGTLTMRTLWTPHGYNYEIQEESCRIATICMGSLLNQDGVKHRANLFTHAPRILDRARELEAEVERLKVPLSVTEIDYRTIMRVNKALKDMVEELTTQDQLMKMQVVDEDIIEFVNDEEPKAEMAKEWSREDILEFQKQIELMADGTGNLEDTALLNKALGITIGILVQRDHHEP